MTIHEQSLKYDSVDPFSKKRTYFVLQNISKIKVSKWVILSLASFSRVIFCEWNQWANFLNKISFLVIHDKFKTLNHYFHKTYNNKNWRDRDFGWGAFTSLQSWSKHFEPITWCFTNFSFSHKWIKGRLIVRNMA